MEAHAFDGVPCSTNTKFTASSGGAHTRQYVESPTEWVTIGGAATCTYSSGPQTPLCENCPEKPGCTQASEDSAGSAGACAAHPKCVHLT